MIPKVFLPPFSILVHQTLAALTRRRAVARSVSVALLSLGFASAGPRALGQTAPWLGGYPADYEGCIPSPEDGIFCGGDGPPPFTGPLTTFSISSHQALALTAAYLAATNYQYNFSNNSTLTVTGPEELGTLSASFSGQGSFIFAGGQLRLIYNNSLTGDFIIGSGRLVLDSWVPFPNMNTMIVAGGTLAFGTSNPTLGIVQVNGNGRLELLSGASASIGAFTGTGPLRISGPGYLNVRAASAFTGGVQLSGGATLGVISSSTLGSAGETVVIGADSGLRFSRNFTLDHPIESTGGRFHLTAADYVQVNVDAPISGSGELLLKGSGPGAEFTLSQTNSQTGGLAIEESTVHFTTDANLGAAGGKVSFYQGGVLATPAGFTSNRPLVFAEGTGSVSVDSGTVNLSGNVSGAGEFAKQGAGTLVLSGANSATGGLHVADGTVRLGAANALPTGRLKVDGTLELNGYSTTGGSLAGTGTIALGGSTLTLQQDTAQSFAGQITGTGGITKTGSATLTLLTPLAYSGATIVRAGSLAAGAANVLSASSALFIINGAQVSLNGHNQTVGDLDSYDVATGNFYSAGTVQLGGATLTNLNRVTNNWGGTVAGNGTLIKQGTAVMNWRGANSFTGTLQIAAGTVNAQIAGTLSPNAVVQINAGATLALNNYAQTIAGLAGSGTASLGSATLSVAQATDTAFAGALTGTGKVVKSGSGSLTLSGANTFSGGLAINGGTVAVSTNAHLGAATGQLTFDGGTLRATNSFTSTRTVSVDAHGGGFQVDATHTLAWNGAIAGSGTLTKSGTGTLELGVMNPFNGALVIDAGTVRTQVAESVSPDTRVTIASGATLDLNNSSHSFAEIAGAGNITLGYATLATTQSVDTTFSGVISGTGYLGKEGSGTLTLGGANTFTGGVVFAEGAVSVANDGNLGHTSGGLSFAGGTLATTASFSSNRAIEVLYASAVHTATDTTLTLTGTISGEGDLTKRGAGTLVLAGTNASTGATAIDAGTLRMGVNQALSTGSHVAIGAQATLDLHGHQLTVATLSGDTHATVELGNQGALTLGDATHATFGGAISGTGSVTKVGSGDLSLTGTSSFTGTARVQAGALVMNGHYAHATIDVANHATLAGSGTIGGLTLNAGATLAPGNSPGTLTVAGDATWNGGANYVWEINNAANPQSPGAAGTNYDLLSISGALTLAATSENKFTLSLVSLLANNSAGDVVNFNSSVNSSYVIASAAGGILGFDASAFTINATGFSNALAGGTWSLALANSNKDLQLNFTAATIAAPIPEPSTYAALAGLSALALAAWRRHRHRQ